MVKDNNKDINHAGDGSSKGDEDDSGEINGKVIDGNK